MKILYSPIRSDRILHYEFNGEKIKATLDGISDEFDFTDMPDGIATDIETILDINPIIEAKRENGTLYVKLLYFHGANATEEERFPQWQEVS